MTPVSTEVYRTTQGPGEIQDHFCRECGAFGSAETHRVDCLLAKAAAA